jgi:Spy/CpxP family protein refolding chaperone
MKMKKITLTVAALLFAVVFAASAFAFGCGRGPGYGPRAGGDCRVAAGLDLTAEQMIKIRDMREMHRKEIQPLQDKMFIMRDQIRRLWLEPNPDEAKIAEANKAMRSLRDQVEDKMTAHRLEAMKVLTPEQRAKIGNVAQCGGSRQGRGGGAMQGRGAMQGCGAMQGLAPGGPKGMGCPGGRW